MTCYMYLVATGSECYPVSVYVLKLTMPPAYLPSMDRYCTVPIAVVGVHCVVSAGGRGCWSPFSQHCVDLQQYSSAARCARGVISAEGAFDLTARSCAAC